MQIYGVIQCRSPYRMMDSINNDQSNLNGNGFYLRKCTHEMYIAYTSHMHYYQHCRHCRHHRHRRMKWINRLFALVNSDIRFCQCALDNAHLLFFSSSTFHLLLFFQEEEKKTVRSPV